MFTVRKLGGNELGVVEHNFIDNQTIEGNIVITIEKENLWDLIRITVLCCVEMTNNWPVAVMELNFPSCAIGVKDSCSL